MDLWEPQVPKGKSFGAPMSPKVVHAENMAMSMPQQNPSNIFEEPVDEHRHSSREIMMKCDFRVQRREIGSSVSGVDDKRCP